MGGHSTTSTSTTSQEKVTETNFQNSGGLTVAGNKGNTTVQTITNSTDDGAVRAALASNSQATAAALSANTDVSRAAIDLGSKAIDAGTQVANAGLDNAAAAYQGGLTFGRDALGTVEDLATEFSQRNADLTASALSGYQSIAQQNSASDSTQVQKVALWAIGAAVLLALISSGRVRL